MSCDLRVPPAPAAFLLTFLGASFAPASDWRALPITEELDIETAAVSPVDADHAFVWSGIGYRSTNGGDTWQMLVCSFEGRERGPVLDQLAFDPIDANAIWAVTEGQPVRSTDLGETWRDWGTPPPSPVVEFVPDWAAPTVSAWAVGGSGIHRGVYRTTDSGATWIRRDDGLDVPDARSIAPSPVDPLCVLLGTTDGIARSTDGGGSWTWVRVGAVSDRIRWHADATHVSAVVDDRWLFRSSDSGGSWEENPAPIHVDFWEGNVDYEYDDLDPSRLLTASLSYCSVSMGSYGYAGVAKTTTDAGDSWSRQFVSGCIRGYDPDPFPGIDVRGDRAWVWYPALGSGPKALQRSTDGGGTWRPIVNGIHEAPTGTVAAGAGGHLWAQRPAGKISRSTDLGATWSPPDELPAYGETFGGATLQASRTRPDDLFAVARWADYDYGGLVYWRSTNGGVTWLPPFADPEGIPITYYDGARIAYNHGTGSTVYIWISRNENGPTGELYRSDDGNVSYTLIDGDSFFPVAAVISPESDAHVYAVVEAPEPVWLSTDSGATWEIRSAGLPERTPVTLLVAPADGGHLAVVFETGAPFESLDGGLSWQPLSEGLVPGRAVPDPVPKEGRLPETARLRGVTITGGDWDVVGTSRRIFLSTDSGPWISDDGFATGGLPMDRIDGIVYSRESEQLLVWSERHGTFALEWPAIPDPGRGVLVASAGVAPGTLPLVVAPNPFTGTASVSFGQAAEGHARVDVFDASGRRVATLLDGRLRPGSHSVEWSGRDRDGRFVAPGVYFLRLSTPAGEETRRAVRLR